MDFEQRYSRQIMLPTVGVDGQKALAQKKIMIIGVGGLGSATAIYLAGAGVGHITLLDNDVVSVSNLHRQVLYSECEVGLPKSLMAARRLAALNSDIEIKCIDTRLTADNAAELLQGYDLILDCTDNFVTRYIIDDACAALDTPWVYGSISEFAGQLSLFNGPSKTRYCHLYPEREQLCSAPKPVPGVLGATPGVIGSMQAAEAVKVLLDMEGTLDGKLFYINLLTFETHLIQI